MRVAHLILTYTNPAQTERMIKAMWHEDFDYYIHVDKKFDITPHLILQNIPNVYFIEKRTDVRWSGFSTIIAEFESIKEIVSTGRNYSFINLLSGQGYPVRPPQEIANFYRDNVGKEFLEFKDFIHEWPEGLLRMDGYFISDYNFPGRFRLEQAMTMILPKKRIPYNLHPYGKSMFWMLSPEAALYVVNKVENDPKLKRFFSLSWASDEFVFPTILMNSEYKDKVVNNNYRYIDWSAGGANPKVLLTEDFEPIMESNKLFARKFTADASGVLMDKIDAVINPTGKSIPEISAVKL